MPNGRPPEFGPSLTAMLKISQVEVASRFITLRLEGRIVGPWVAELRQSCEQILREDRSLRLHLADVEFMDANGVTLLIELRSRGVSFIDSRRSSPSN
jgi:ABC-type transporter Mla MlaB component